VCEGGKTLRLCQGRSNPDIGEERQHKGGGHDWNPETAGTIVVEGRSYYRERGRQEGTMRKGEGTTHEEEGATLSDRWRKVRPVGKENEAGERASQYS
jgi:hypothetical protein